MYDDDDEELQGYFAFYNPVGAEENCGNKSPAISVKEESGINCRACFIFNKYATPDQIIEDGKFTCWSCANHPERKRMGLPPDKVKDLEKYYMDNYKTYRRYAGF